MRLVILDLHFEGPNGGFKDIVSFRHEFSLAADEHLADVVRRLVQRWAGERSRLLHSRIEFSDREWRAWSSSSEYSVTFTQFVADRTGRAIGLSRALSEYLGCDDVDCVTAPRSAPLELVEA